MGGDAHTIVRGAVALWLIRVAWQSPSALALLLMGRQDAPCLRPSVGRSEMRSEVAAQLLALCFDANDPLRLARLWTGFLGLGA